MPLGYAGVHFLYKAEPIIEDYYNGHHTIDELYTKRDDCRNALRKRYVCTEDTATVSLTLLISIYIVIFHFAAFGMLFMLIPIIAALPSMFIVAMMRPFNLFLDEKNSASLHSEELIRIEKEIEQLESYNAAILAWKNYNTETGHNYWLSLRGEALEYAVASMLRRIGWTVETTKKSGDGGIDLIISKDSKRILAQCKGYAEKIGVAPIRDAAGVKSISGDEFVVIGPSGFTAGAVEFAVKSGIVLWDVRKLTTIAEVGYF